MSEISFFINDLLKRAEKNNDNELISKIKTQSFYNSLKESCDVFKALNLQVVNIDEMHNYEKEINYKISKALEKNFFAIFYINLKTNEYLGHSDNNDFINLNVSKCGDNFFEDILTNIKKVVYYKDQDNLCKALSKENLDKETQNGKTYTIIHRLVIDNKKTFIEIKAMRIDEFEDGIVLGLSNIDEQKKLELEYKHQMEENSTYFNIALSLVKNYFVVYYVDVTNSSYIQYSINSELQKLEYVDSGTDFFADSKKNALKYIVNEDQEKFIFYLDRKNLLKEISQGKVFTLTYQQLINRVPTYVQLTAINLLNDSSHVILAVLDIDKQMKKDEEYQNKLEVERKLARTDALTGVMNKYSYNEVESGINKAITAGKNVEFGILVCDINDLKIINDTLGHEAGDRIIKKAAALLSSTFANSNIYRVGGDEFAVILEGTDYYKIDHLVKNIVESNKNSKKLDDLVLAWGYSIFDKEEDSCPCQVFSKADEKMYENKRYLKEVHKY